MANTYVQKSLKKNITYREHKTKKGDPANAEHYAELDQILIHKRVGKRHNRRGSRLESKHQSDHFPILVKLKFKLTRISGRHEKA